MSRRWYRHAAKVVFFGWDPGEQGFYVNVVDLCSECRGTGEVGDTEEVCPGCGGEGIQLSKMNPSARRGGLSLDDLSAEFARQELPLLDYMRADLEADREANSATALQEYELS
ncbi:MAG: zinc finger-like domain-containing protein [Chloroflexi bacterium]|nr:zinc finger-like domain-containing protein [Chloroflexota bacterium]MBV9598937.1 zinc finger-like domain-containing protein [Chloroflexota bacterium]